MEKLQRNGSIIGTAQRGAEIARELAQSVRTADGAVHVLRQFVVEHTRDGETRADGALQLSTPEIHALERLTLELYRTLPAGERLLFFEQTRIAMLDSERWLSGLSEVDHNALQAAARKMQLWTFFVEVSEFAEHKDARTAAAVLEDYIRFCGLNSRRVVVPQGEQRLTTDYSGEQVWIRELAYHLWESLPEAERPKFLEQTGQAAIKAVLTGSDVFEPTNDGDRYFLEQLSERMRRFTPTSKPEPEAPKAGGFTIRKVPEI